MSAIVESLAPCPANVTQEEREEFFRAYVAAALWTASDEEGEPLDSLYFVEDFSEDALRSMREDCDDFLTSHGDLIRTLDYGMRGGQWSNFDLAGHDFLLTRQGHGAGFWDRGLGEAGDYLTDMSKPYGDTYVYVSDNNELEVD